nr:type II secretion system protein [Psychromonas aquimarina]
MLSYKSFNQGFTLIELVVVIIILGVLSAVALPKFTSLSKEAKVNVITQIKVSVKVANDFMFLKSNMPSYAAQPVPNRDDLIDVDTNGDGSYDTRLKWHYLDNTDIEKRIDISDDFAIEYEGIEYTYIGYDTDNDNQVQDNNCYFKYTQASASGVPPDYDIEYSGC